VTQSPDRQVSSHGVTAHLTVSVRAVTRQGVPVRYVISPSTVSCSAAASDRGISTHRGRLLYCPPGVVREDCSGRPPVSAVNDVTAAALAFRKLHLQHSRPSCSVMSDTVWWRTTGARRLSTSSPMAYMVSPIQTQIRPDHSVLSILSAAALIWLPPLATKIPRASVPQIDDKTGDGDAANANDES
jgi:hypothetical protein